MPPLSPPLAAADHGFAGGPPTLSPPATRTPHRRAQSFNHTACADIVGGQLAKFEETYAEPNYDNEDVRERKLLLDDLASDRDDFARSSEEGWFFSDED